MELEVRGQELVVLSCGELVSGTVGVYRAEFSFAPEWAGLAATAVFRSEPYSGGESVERKAVLGADGACAVPWEVLAQGGGFLKVGVYGVDAAGTVIVPTLWCRAGYIAKGTPTDASPGQDPTPTVAEQMTAEFAAARAEVVAEADRAEASARQAEADAAETARLAGEVADHAAQAAEDRAATAADRTAATIARTHAEAAQAAAEAAQAAAETAQRAAETAKAGAETSAGSAASAAQTATGKAAEAVQSAKDAADALTEGRRVLAQVVEAGSTSLAAIGAAGTGQVKAVNDAGTAKVKAVTDEGAKQAKAVQDKGTEQVAAVRTEGEAQTANAKTEADRAQAERERIEGLDVYTRTETDILLAGKADQPYKELITPASVEDSAGGRVVVDRLDGNTVQRAYVHTVGESTQVGTPAPDTPVPITPGLAGGKYQVRTHRGLYECTLPDGHGLGDVRDKLVVDPVTGTGKWVAALSLRDIKVSNGYQDGAHYAVVGVMGYPLPPVIPLCTHYVGSEKYSGAMGNGMCSVRGGANVSIWFKDTRFTTKEDFTAYLAAEDAAGRTVKALYQLATPVVTDITLTPVSFSNASVLPVEWVDYAPTPEVPVTMESVERGKMWSVGRNLWDRAYTEDITSWTQTYATIYLYGFTPGESYTISATLIAGVAPTDAALTVSDADLGNVRTLFRYTDTGRKNYVFVAQTATMAVRIRWSGSAVAAQAVIAVTNWLTDIQLEAGTDATPYTPYTGHTYDIPLPQALRAGDSVELVDGRYKQVVRTMRRVLDGTTTISNVMERDKTVRGLMGFGDGKIDNVNVNLLCDGVPVYPPDGVWLTDKEGICRIKQTNPAIQGVVLSVNKARLSATDAAGLAAWLASHPVTVDYDLAAPVYFDLPDSTQALLRSIVTAPGVAHLWFEGAVVPSMTAAYRLELTAWVKSVTQTQQQGATAAYLSLVADEQGGTEQDLARIMHEQHATGAELSNIETQQAITDLMIGGLSHGF